MLERALPVVASKVTLGEDDATDRRGSILRGLVDRMERMLRAVGMFLAAGGPLS